GSCGMPYHISGEVETRDSLVNMTPEKFKQKNIDVKTCHEVIAVHPHNNTVTVLDKNNNIEFIDSYDYLILSPGGSPRMLPVLKDTPQTFSLNKIEDLDDLMAYIETHNISEALVVGSGFIGLEVIEKLSERGISVTMLQHEERIYKNIEAEMNGMLYEAMNENGITLKLNTEITKIDGETAELSNG